MNAEQVTLEATEVNEHHESKVIQLDWTESEWFQVWLKLARHNQEESFNAS